MGNPIVIRGGVERASLQVLQSHIYITISIKGNLYIIPSSISEGNLFPENNKVIIKSINHFVAENIKVSLSFVKRICPEKKISYESK